ncbi:MAG TPA: MBOAT family O-acyltransferase [Planctomycetota bacterium]|nr:MBOAT family O-acyltransferase [Planctomycetota bacterium]
MDLLGTPALLFLGAVVALLRLPLPFAARRAVLLAFNVAFLASFDPLAPALFLATAAYAFALARRAERGLTGWRLHLACAPLLVPLFLPKLGTFAEQAQGNAANVLGSRMLLFIGASYFTLRALHFVLDARRKGRAALPFVDYLVWNSFFPTIVAGPIERSEHFAKSYGQLGRASREDVAAGLTRIFHGLLKRAVAAPLCLAWAGDITGFRIGEVVPAGEAWLALYAICLYAYFDFAGYSDLALGAARLLGIRLAENFDQPYLRTSIAGFWQGWHISLSQWIRDYLFIPFCGRSPSKLRPHVAAVASMALCGLWHGVTPGWVLWGVAHGGALSAHQVWTGWLRKRPRLKKRLAASTAARVAAVLLTFHFVALSWTLISIDTRDLRPALHYVAALLGL